MSQQQLEPVLLRSSEGVRIGKERFLVWSEQFLIEGFLHIPKGHCYTEIPAGFFAAVEPGCLGLNADDIAVLLSFFEQWIVICLPEPDKLVGIAPFDLIIAFDGKAMGRVAITGRLSGPKIPDNADLNSGRSLINGVLPATDEARR